MRQPWEDSVIIALRDAQWIQLNDSDVDKKQQGQTKTPGLFVKLSANPEQNLGDLIFSASDRYYLFEVKSGRDQLRSEWAKKVDGKLKPKQAFLTLQKLSATWFKCKHNSLLSDAVSSSLRCHHFLYWSRRPLTGGGRTAALCIEPYLLGCAANGAPNMPEDFSTLEVLEKANGTSKLVRHTQRESDKLGLFLSLEALLDSRGLVMDIPRHNNSQSARSLVPMGLPLHRFKEYLVFLTSSGLGGDGSLNAVVCSDNGYLQRLKSFDDLKLILGKAAKLTCAPLKCQELAVSSFFMNDAADESFAAFPALPRAIVEPIQTAPGPTQTVPGSTQVPPGSTQTVPGSTQVPPGSTRPTRRNGRP